jgi:rhodanese-related sulfurtransferase
MTLGECKNRTTHIPGSMRISTVQEALEALDPKDEIVLYDSGPPCPASRLAFRILKAHGYERVRRHAGGLEAWATAGYPLEGESVE